MIKKLFLLSSILTLSACSSLSERMQCDPEKNYIISNPEAMEKYKKEQANGEIKSIYYNILDDKSCENNSCIFYNNLKYNFIEIKFNDKQGVYTVKTSSNYSNPNCIFKNNELNIKGYKKCYLLEKNVNDKINSTYMYTYIHYSNLKYNNLKLINIKDNIVLFDVAYQTYTINSLGASGGGICPKLEDNNPNYKFNPISFN